MGGPLAFKNLKVFVCSNQTSTNNKNGFSKPWRRQGGGSSPGELSSCQPPPSWRQRQTAPRQGSATPPPLPSKRRTLVV